MKKFLILFLTLFFATTLLLGAGGSSSEVADKTTLQGPDDAELRPSLPVKAVSYRVVSVVQPDWDIDPTNHHQATLVNRPHPWIYNTVESAKNRYVVGCPQDDWIGGFSCMGLPKDKEFKVSFASVAGLHKTDYMIVFAPDGQGEFNVQLGWYLVVFQTKIHRPSAR
jgi:hypothetical protein